MKKRVLISCMFPVFLCLMLVFNACAEKTVPANSNNAPETNTATSTTQTAVKTIELKHSAFCSPAMAIGKVMQEWADRVYEKSEGRLKITIYFSEALSPLIDNYKAVQSGIADTADFNVGSNPGAQELSRITQLPFMGHTSYEEANAIFTQLYETYPEIQSEWKGVKVMGPRHMPGFQFNFTKEEVHVPADMKGMKIITQPSFQNFLIAAGAAPVQISYGDWYMSLERGLVEGLPTHLVAAYAMKLTDLLKYHTLFGEFGCANNLEVFLINQKVWESLPADLQDVLTESLEWRVEHFTQSDSDQLKVATQVTQEEGHHVVNLTEDEMNQWLELAKESEHAKWINDNTDANSQAIYDAAIKLIKEYK